MEIIVEQILMLTIMVVVGILSSRFKLLTHNVADVIVKVITKLTLPLLIFTTFAGIEINLSEISNLLYIFFSSFFTVLVAFVLSRFSGKILKLDKENKALHSVHTMFGNVVFLGFPLLNSLFPDGRGLMYATIFQLGHDALMWTWGIFTLNSAAKQKSSKNWKHLINPNTVAFLVGLIFMISNLNLPKLVFKPLYDIGHTTIYLSMIYIGLILASVRFSSLISSVRVYLLSLNKLILTPIIILFIYLILSNFGLKISSEAVSVVALQAAMPCMIIISVLAKEMGLNAKQAIENIFVTSVLSIISLPFIYWLTQKMIEYCS